MDWSKIEAQLAQGLKFVSDLAPAAAAGGPLAGEIGGIVGAVAGFAAKALAAAEAEQAVVASSDLASIRASAAGLRAINDQLAAQIAAGG